MAKLVVLIDDDEDDLEIMKEALNEFDRSILTVSFLQPERAIQEISGDLISNPDFIFIDINMTPFTGDRCLLELRKNPSLNDTKIAMFSTSIPKFQSVRLLQSGANFTFQKPNTFEGYREVLNQIFS